MRALVVVPTFNEADNIEAFLTRVRAAAPDADVLVVDDNSPDGTADKAEKLGIELGRVSVLRRAQKDGLGNAYRAGFRQGLAEGYDVLVQIDADLSFDPAMVPELLAKVESGYDVAVGSRYVPGGDTPNWPTHRRALSRYGNRYAGWALGLRLRDATSGFRAYRDETLRAIEYQTTRANGYAFQTEIGYRISDWGGTIAEVPIIFTDRERGTSKMSARIIVESMALVTFWGIRLRARKLARKVSRRREAGPRHHDG